MKKKIKVSVLTVCFNSENHIEKTIQSVLSQTYKNIEFIVIDGKSNDNTLSIINSYKNRISKIISKPDLGPYDALNKAIMFATGDILCVLHSDDIFYDSYTVSSVVNAFSSGKADVLYGNLQYVNKSQKEKVFRDWKSGTFSPYKLSFGWMPPHPTVFIKPSLVREKNLYNLKYSISADYDWVLNIFKQKKIKIIFFNRTITKMSVGGMSNNSARNILVKLFQDYLIAKCHFKYPALTIFSKNIQKIYQLRF